MCYSYWNLKILHKKESNMWNKRFDVWGKSNKVLSAFKHELNISPLNEGLATLLCFYFIHKLHDWLLPGHCILVCGMPSTHSTLPKPSSHFWHLLHPHTLYLTWCFVNSSSIFLSSDHIVRSFYFAFMEHFAFPL